MTAVREMEAGQARKFADAMSRFLDICGGATVQEAFEVAVKETGLGVLFHDDEDAHMIEIGAADTEESSLADWSANST